MKAARAFADVPTAPAVYSMYGGSGKNRYVAYVGIAGNVRRRIYQHLMRRSSSIVTGAAAVSLNPELVTAVDWWEHQQFEQSDDLRAAELIAFDVLSPVLRSRGNVSDHIVALSKDLMFVEDMTMLFKNHPTGRFVPMSLAGAMGHIARLEERITALERRLDTL